MNVACNYMDGYSKSICELKKTTKSEAMFYINEIHDLMANGPITREDEFCIGNFVAKLKNYFAPAMLSKKDDLSWCIQALSSKSSEKRDFTKLAVYIDGLGLCATDSHRVHIAKIEQKGKYFVPKSGWISEDNWEGEQIHYPYVQRLLECDSYIKTPEEDIFAIDLDTIGVYTPMSVPDYNSLKKECKDRMRKFVERDETPPEKFLLIYNPIVNSEYGNYKHVQMYDRKYYNQMVAGCEDYSLSIKYKCPLILDGFNRKAALVCLSV